MNTHFAGKALIVLAAASAAAALITAVFAGCAAGTAVTANTSGKDIQTNVFQNVSYSDAKSLIANSSGLVILDVRTPEEYAAGHLENAVNIDYKAASFRDNLGQLDKTKNYLVYFRTGGRSLESVKIMTELGFLHANNLLGGITQWEADGGTISKE